jgi:putative transposase
LLAGGPHHGGSITRFRLRTFTETTCGVRHFSRFSRSGLRGTNPHTVLLGTARRRDLFLTVLEQVRRKYRFVVAGYVVMLEHIHLLISEPQNKTPSTVMQALKIGFSRRVLAQARRRHNPAQATLFDASPQHIWQKRFYDFNVWTEHKRIEKLRYMHRNPVTRGLAASPELWRWSSFRAYSLGETGQVKVNDGEVLKMKVRTQAR